MTTALNDTAKLAVLKPAPRTIDTAAEAALEQMFGYFSFEPMPTERVEERLAA
ncbi:hypothetical protein [Paracoccus laeviglucosivorans]|uniref:Uncharacterized protein n=1 Tax=Paracoccus laeviglucosivorans TaxID=1197861 RepID=A0A521AQL1_9RHOB|nr:hypothetical protein [Paracoccus laeviglucosivorans]SMO37075.1 hypothetical protein SAMN06265221_101267 [Paracoccus laeviglucosivorans]